MSKIIITGATSAYIDALIDCLLQDNYEITGLTRKVSDLHRNDIKWIECDLTGTGNEYKFLEEIDIVIHAAAISNLYSRKEYMRANYLPTVKLVDASKKYGVKRFIYISSILAYQECGDYGSSKHLAEKYVRNKLNNWTIIQPSQLYGYSARNAVDALINTVSKKKLLFYPSSTPYNLYPLHYLDAALETYKNIIESKNDKEVVVIAGKNAFNFLSLAKFISMTIASRTIYIPVPRFVSMIVYNILKYSGMHSEIPADKIYRLYHGKSALKGTIPNKARMKEYLLEHPGCIRN